MRKTERILQFFQVHGGGFRHELFGADVVKGDFQQGVAAHLGDCQYHAPPKGRMLHHIPMNEQFITNQLIYSEKPYLPSTDDIQYVQPTLFDYGMH